MTLHTSVAYTTYQLVTVVFSMCKTLSFMFDLMSSLHAHTIYYSITVCFYSQTVTQPCIFIVTWFAYDRPMTCNYSHLLG